MQCFIYWLFAGKKQKFIDNKKIQQQWSLSEQEVIIFYTISLPPNSVTGSTH